MKFWQQLAFVLAAFSAGASVFAQHKAEVEMLLKSADWETALARLSTETQLRPYIVKALGHVEAAVRSRAAIAIRSIEDAEGTLTRFDESKEKELLALQQEAVTALMRNAAESDPELRRQSVIALAFVLKNRRWGHHGEPWSDPNELKPLVDLGRIATPGLVEVLGMAEGPKRGTYAAKISACRVLAKTKDPKATEALIALVNGSEHFLLSEAMTALSQLDDPRVPRVLIDNLEKDIHSYEDTPGVWALKRMKDRALPDLLWAISSHPKAEVRGLAAHLFEHTPDPRSVPALQAALKDQDEKVRAWAAGALSKNPHPGNAALLVSLLADESETVRGAAVSAIGQFKDKSLFNVLAGLLTDPKERVQQYAIVALAELGDSRATAKIIPFLKKESMQRTAVASLKLLKGPQTEAALIQLLPKGDDYARSDACEILGEMKSAKAVPPLVDLLLSEDWYLAGSAAKALGAIGAKGADALLPLLPKVSEKTLPYLIEALGGTRDARAFDALVPLLNRDKMTVHTVEALGLLGDSRAIPLVLPHLAAPDDWLRRTAVESLGLLRSTEAVPALIKALNDKGEYVSSTAAEALGRIADKRAFEPLMKVAQDPDFGGRWMAIEGLGAFCDARAVPVLIKLLEEDWPDSAAAARALGRLGDRSAIAALEKAAKSEDDKTAADAKAALAAIGKAKSG